MSSGCTVLALVGHWILSRLVFCQESALKYERGKGTKGTFKGVIIIMGHGI